MVKISPICKCGDVYNDHVRQNALANSNEPCKLCECNDFEEDWSDNLEEFEKENR